MEPGTACRLLQPLRCAGTTARTCALGTRGTAIRLGFEPCPTRFRAPFIGPAELPRCQPPTCVANRRGEVRRPREPLLPPARPREGPLGLSPHGGNWSGRFLAASSIPVSPESVPPAQMVCATRVETGQDPQSWGAPRRDALVRGTEVPFTAAGSKLDAWSRPSLHATPPTLPPDDSAFGTGRCD